jgi:hypothetical protein
LPLENSLENLMFARTLAGLAMLALAVPLHAQTIHDGVMLKKGTLFAGNVYAHDSWDLYWEGELKRNNGNIGTVTTQSNMLFGNYGLTDRFNIIVAAPYVWTRVSQGVLSGMSGFQDITLAAKVNLIEKATGVGALRGILVASGGIPLTDYISDFAPLSIGSGSKRVAVRGTFNLHNEGGLYLNGSSAYTWRAAVRLDRPYFFTDGELTFSDLADMPNVFDYAVTGGYAKHGVMATMSLTQQHTLGGGDIRRQDMPFVSNRMNFTRVGGMIMAPIPKFRSLAGEFTYTYTVGGRNVGQATTITAGLMYTFPFYGRTGR